MAQTLLAQQGKPTSPPAGFVKLYVKADGFVYSVNSAGVENRITASDGSNANVLIQGITVGKGGKAVESNVAVGINALLSNTTGHSNVAISTSALTANLAGHGNVAVGVRCLKDNAGGYNNIGAGADALAVNTTGHSNVAIGNGALASNTTGPGSVALGGSCGGGTTGIYNVSIGYQCLPVVAAGSENVAMGFRSQYAAKGGNNTTIGTYTMQDLTSGSDNTVLGHNSGRGITTGSSNTVLGGAVTGLAAALAKNILIASGDGVVKFQHNEFAWFMHQLAPVAINASATATIAGLLTQIVTSTSAAITDITLPTGTLMDGALISSLDMAFDWSVINTGPSAVNLVAGTDHTIVGSLVTATATSSRWRSRRTAAAVWVTYRISV